MLHHDSEFCRKIVGMFQQLKQENIRIRVDGDQVEIWRRNVRVKRLPLLVFQQLEANEIIAIALEGQHGKAQSNT